MDVQPGVEGVACQDAGKVAQRHVDAQPDEALAHVERLAAAHLGGWILAVAEYEGEHGQRQRVGDDRGQDAALTQQVEQRH